MQIRGVPRTPNPVLFCARRRRFYCPLAQRYPLKVYDRAGTIWYFVAVGAPEVRRAMELLVNWKACEFLESRGFRPHEETGEEGFFGPAAEANRVVEARLG